MMDVGSTQTGTAGDDTLLGGSGDDIIYGGSGNDVLGAGEGDDSLFGGSGNDTLSDQIGTNWLYRGEGDDVLHGASSSGYDSFYGGAGQDRLVGGQDNSFYGGAGNDVLNDNGNSQHLMNGGDGDDLYILTGFYGAYLPISGETASGGFDRIEIGGTSDDFSMPAHIEEIVLREGAGPNVYGNNQANRIVGNSSNNYIIASGGDDTVYGRQGNDWLEGGGKDSLVGGMGNDMYDLRSAEVIVVEGASSGVDTVRAKVSVVLAAGVEDLDFYETGFAALNGTGNALNNVITGNEGSNTLVGGRGNDHLYGGGVWDDDRLVGGAGNDTLEGKGGQDLLFGGADDDTLLGGSGDESLFGGSGNDVLDEFDTFGGDNLLKGGLGDDTYILRSYNGNTLVEASGEGSDTINAYFDMNLAANFENLVLVSRDVVYGGGNALANKIMGNGIANTLMGFAGADQLFGGGGRDRLDGGAGRDRMEGGLGADTFIVDSEFDRVVEQDGDGTDRVLASASHVLAAHVENLKLTGQQAIGGTGNASANQLRGNDATNLLSGKGGDDDLFGGSGADKLAGGDGRDLLLGDAGQDILQGGRNDDLFVFAGARDAGDRITDFSNLSGNDDDIAISASGFGGLLLAGAPVSQAQFQVVQAGNVGATTATGSAARFLWEKDDERLWFDSNGSGSGGLTLLADLQDGAVVTRSDLLIF